MKNSIKKKQLTSKSCSEIQEDNYLIKLCKQSPDVIINMDFRELQQLLALYKEF